MARWRVTIEFTDDDGEDDYDEIDVEASTEELAKIKAEDIVKGIYDIDEIDEVDAVLL